MRRRHIALLAACLLAGPGCPGGGASTPPPDAGTPGATAGEVNLYIWSEYIDPALLEAFTQRTGTKVNVSLFESSEEMLAKLQHAAGASQYDVVVASNQSIPAMVRLGLVRPLDHALLPHLEHLAPRFRDPRWDPKSQHSVAYLWGTVGLLYDRQKLPDLPPTWGVLFDPAQQRGTFKLIDEARDQLGAALKYLGHSVNATDPAALKAAGEAVLAAKRSERCLGFAGGVGGKNEVLGGLVDAAVVWNGDAYRAVLEAPDRLAFVVPKEGSVLWCDTLVVTKDAPNPAGAHALLDYLLEAEVAAKNSAFVKYATPNQAALAHVPEADRTNPVIYPPEAVLQTLEPLVDLGADLRLYDEVWTAVKAR